MLNYKIEILSVRGKMLVLICKQIKKTTFVSRNMFIKQYLVHILVTQNLLYFDSYASRCRSTRGNQLLLKSSLMRKRRRKRKKSFQVREINHDIPLILKWNVEFIVLDKAGFENSYR